MDVKQQHNKQQETSVSFLQEGHIWNLTEISWAVSGEVL